MTARNDYHFKELTCDRASVYLQIRPPQTTEAEPDTQCQRINGSLVRALPTESAPALFAIHSPPFAHTNAIRTIARHTVCCSGLIAATSCTASPHKRLPLDSDFRMITENYLIRSTHSAPVDALCSCIIARANKADSCNDLHNRLAVGCRSVSQHLAGIDVHLSL